MDHFVGEVDARSGKPITSRAPKKAMDNGYSAGWGNTDEEFESYNFYGELNEVSAGSAVIPFSCVCLTIPSRPSLTLTGR